MIFAFFYIMTSPCNTEESNAIDDNTLLAAVMT
jgi:hypothetical protein